MGEDIHGATVGRSKPSHLKATTVLSQTSAVFIFLFTFKVRPRLERGHHAI